MGLRMERGVHFIGEPNRFVKTPLFFHRHYTQLQNSRVYPFKLLEWHTISQTSESQETNARKPPFSS